MKSLFLLIPIKWRRHIRIWLRNIAVIKDLALSFSLKKLGNLLLFLSVKKSYREKQAPLYDDDDTVGWDHLSIYKFGLPSPSSTLEIALLPVFFRKFHSSSFISYLKIVSRGSFSQDLSQSFVLVIEGVVFGFLVALSFNATTLASELTLLFVIFCTFWQ